MGNADTKLHFRKAVLQLTTKTQPIPSSDDAFWNQFWGEYVSSVSDVFVMLPASEVRALREAAPSNLATLCYKAVEKLVSASDTGVSTQQDQQSVINCVRILTRVLPYIFEDPDWRGFFWSNLPTEERESDADPDDEPIPLANSLVNALCDLLFCPDFTVTPNKKNAPDAHEDLQSLDSCEYIWEAGVGASHAPAHNVVHDNSRKEILKLLLTCFSQIIYQGDATEGVVNHLTNVNPWLCLFTSCSNRHALPLFTSLLNTVCGYDAVGRGLPYNHLLFHDSRESLVEVCLQIMITALDSQDTLTLDDESTAMPDNLFINYLSRIHREEDFGFVLRGFTRLLNNPLQQTYLPHSAKKINFHQELLVFFWKFCDYNKKFLFYVLKSSEVLEVLVPILYHLNDARADQSRVGLLHIGVFILLLLSGERNFGVRLNKPYTAAVPMDIPVFTGSHADLMVIVFHKIITTGHQRLQPLFDCLLTILVNVSPYLKSLSMVASNKLLHLLEAFCTPWFMFSAPHHHHLVFFLLETFNNIIQYQFDGNSNLVYTLIRKRQVFHSLASLPIDSPSINKILNSRKGSTLMGKRWGSKSSNVSSVSTKTSKSETAVKAVKDDLPVEEDKSVTKEEGGVEETNEMMEGAQPPLEAPPGTKTATLLALPRLDKMTEQESAHPTSVQLSELTLSNAQNEASSPQTDSTIITALGADPVSDPPAPANLENSFSQGEQAGGSTSVVAVRLTVDSNGVAEPRKDQYPPSPHSSSAVQPPSNEHYALGYFKTVKKELKQQEETKLKEETRLKELIDSSEKEQSPDSTDLMWSTESHDSKVSKLLNKISSSRKRSEILLSTDDDGEEQLLLVSEELEEREEEVARDGQSASTKAGNQKPYLSSYPAQSSSSLSESTKGPLFRRSDSVASSVSGGVDWCPSSHWVVEWKKKLPLQTIMRLLQVLVPQVEKICIDKGLTDESEILRFLQHGTLVGLLPVPHPILIRKYQANSATAAWFRTYMWGVIYLRNVDPPIWYDTAVKLFEIQRV